MLRNRVIFLLALATISLVVWQSSALVAATPVSYTLYGSDPEGWGFTNQTRSSPGPELRALQGETVQMTLIAADTAIGYYHDFGVDWNNNTVSDGGEPHSSYFGADPLPGVITYEFQADASPGIYRYYCYVHLSNMWGRFLVGVPPVARFNHNPSSPVIGEPVTFNASDSSDADGTIVSYSWDFGDGTLATGIIAEHSYSARGNYSVTLTVVDNHGLPATASKTVTVEGFGNSAPLPDFDFTPSLPILGQTVYFDASSSQDPDPGDRLVDYSWDFGDGTTLATQTQPLATHTYRTLGTLQISLTVTDSMGASSRLTRPIIVQPVRNVAVTTILIGVESVKAGEPVTIDVAIRNMSNITETFEIELSWNSTQIGRWPATVPAATTLEKSYDWTPPSSGVYVISVRVLVSLDDQSYQDNEKTTTLMVEARGTGLPGVFSWSLAGVVIAAVGATVFYYRKKDRRRSPA